MTNETAALRLRLTTGDRAVLRHLIDGEVRLRHQEELERINATRRRYLAEKQNPGGPTPN